MYNQQYAQAGYERNGNKDYNWDMGPTTCNEITHHMHQIDVLRSYLGLT